MSPRGVERFIFRGAIVQVHTASPEAEGCCTSRGRQLNTRDGLGGLQPNAKRSCLPHVSCPCLSVLRCVCTGRQKNIVHMTRIHLPPVSLRRSLKRGLVHLVPLFSALRCALCRCRCGCVGVGVGQYLLSPKSRGTSSAKGKGWANAITLAGPLARKGTRHEA
eukprot:scaffold19754_cov137-Isochrysis_galbana.AAC.4